MPSRKNGRFSEKKSSFRGSNWNWPCVRLDLREVGIGRGVEVEVVGDAPPDAAAQLGIAPRVVPAGGARRARGPRRERRIELEHQPAPQLGQADQVARLRQERRARPLGRRPRVLGARVLHLAGHVDAPPLLLRRLEAEALERNPDFDLVAVVGEPALRIEHEVGTEVGNLAADDGVVEAVAARRAGFDQRPVGLDAERIHREHRRLAAVVERAEQDLDEVVRADLVAVGERGVHLAVRLVGPDAEVDGGRGIPDQDLGRVHRRHAVHGRELGEAGEQRRLRPGRLVQRPVHRQLRLQPGRVHVQPAGAPVVDGGRIGVTEEQEQRQQHGGSRGRCTLAYASASAGVS